MNSQRKPSDPVYEFVEKIANEIINNPTQAMKITFESLAVSHQWMLYALLDCDQWPYENELIERYEELCPEADANPASKVVNELHESFIRIELLADSQRTVQWSHPTCKDLTVAMLARDHNARYQFLKRSKKEGLQTAFAVAAGAAGKINLPLLRADRDWNMATKRLLESPPDFALRLLVEAVQLTEDESDFDRRALRATASMICLKIRSESNAIWNEKVFNNFLLLRGKLKLPMAFPGFAEHVRDRLHFIRGEQWRSDSVENGFSSAVKDFAAFCSTANQSGPAWWPIIRKSPTFREALQSMCDCVKVYDDNAGEGLTTTEEFRSASEAFDDLSKALQHLHESVGGVIAQNLSKLAALCSSSASWLIEKAWDADSKSQRFDERDGPYKDEMNLRPDQIDDIFRDL